VKQSLLGFSQNLPAANPLRPPELREPIRSKQSADLGREQIDRIGSDARVPVMQGGEEILRAFAVPVGIAQGRETLEEIDDVQRRIPCLSDKAGRRGRRSLAG
jgi:hypothetical protein